MSFAPKDRTGWPHPLSLSQFMHLTQPPAEWAGIRLHGINLSGAKLYNTQLNCADLTDANLSYANLEHANLNGAFLCRTNMQGARLSDAILDHANLINADLTGARLIKSSLQGANLTNANLSGAKLTDTYLNSTWTTETNLVHTNLTDVATLPPELWRAKLYPESQSSEQYVLESTSVKTVGDLLERIREIKAFYERGDEETSFYFRGESQCVWDLRPSVMRNDALVTSEGRMLVDLISRRPEEFSGASSALAQWVLAQHHGLKTRFLDITSNPMVALFHACGIDDNTKPVDGRVHVFAAPRSLVKPFNSDTVSIIANVAKLSRDDQYELVPEPGLGYPSAMRRLYQLIRVEKPYFEERIDPKNFYRVFIVEPQQSSERIRAQSGAFLVSVFHKRFEKDEILKWNADTPVYAHYTLTIPSDRKKGIRDELQLLNITREKLFPGLDVSAEMITEQTLMSAKPWKSRDGSSEWIITDHPVDLDI